MRSMYESNLNGQHHESTLSGLAQHCAIGDLGVVADAPDLDDSANGRMRMAVYAFATFRDTLAIGGVVADSRDLNRRISIW